MGRRTLGVIEPGRIAAFLGELAGQPAAIERAAVVDIERLGYGTLWYGEGFERESFAHGAMLLAAAHSLVIASGIASVWARDAVAMANGAKTLAEAWPGRFILGIGVSHQSEVVIRGHRYAHPAALMREYLDAMSKVPWSGPATEMPPIVLAALGPRMVSLAAEKTSGSYVYFTTAEHLSAVRAAMGPDAFLAADLPVVLEKNRSAARAIGDTHMATYLVISNYRNNLVRGGWAPTELTPPGSDRLFDAIVAWGDVQRVRDRVDSLFAAGADQVVFNPVTGTRGQAYRHVLHALSRLVE